MNHSFRELAKQFSSDLSLSKRKNNLKRQIRFPTIKNRVQEPKYIIKDVVGEGAFAKVSTCLRSTDKKIFVIKTFEKYRLTDDSKRNNILRQIKILKMIKHPNIIEIVDYFQTLSTINIVMEYFSLISLEQFVREHRPLNDKTLREVTKQVSEALVYLHEMKIAHRDLKPENILINEEEKIKLIDLGLASMGQQDLKVAGTTKYMCPQLFTRKNYNPFKADIWAFGIMLYWMVLGYFPQQNSTKSKHENVQKNRKHCQKRKEQNKDGQNSFRLQFPIEMHPGIQYLITKMLASDPWERIDAQAILCNSWLTPINFKEQIKRRLNKSVAALV